ncbi:Pleckstrin-2 [Hondaea fermentalgiana]|uniref:Pleckstrin-2 n=1 Tax=Hondaea fermentalgiana TaxID=2315210 RepID=A0A2R5GLF4_9STRA|nr:Pleckstrin-2 [Hondaea fermentalgiana]|eukprot:GBG31707.1 Pleckstrin-2 [Hondaea fermentalgiana]
MQGFPSSDGAFGQEAQQRGLGGAGAQAFVQGASRQQQEQQQQQQQAQRRVPIGVRAPWEKACTFEGPMLKKSEWLKNWNSRYFRIRGRTLCYYESQTSKIARGEIPLIGAQVALVSVPDQSKRFTLQIRTAKNQDLIFCALSEEDRQNWISQIQTAIRSPPRLQASKRNNATGATTALASSAQGGAGAFSATSATATTPPSAGPGGAPDAEACSTATIEEDEVDFETEQGEKTDAARSSQDNHDVVDDDESLDGTRLSHRYPENFVPPPPPPDADDPLSYLLDVPAPALTSSRAGSPRARGGRHAAGKAGKAKPRVPARQPVQRTSSGEAMQRMNNLSIAADANESGAMDSDAAAMRNAVKAGDLSLVERILSSNPTLATAKDGQNVSVLHLAAMFKREDICMRLLAAGADPTLEDASGETPLSMAPISTANRMRQYQQEHSSNRVVENVATTRLSAATNAASYAPDSYDETTDVV